MPIDLNNNREFPEFNTQAEEIENNCAELKCTEKRISGTVLVCIALITAAGVVGGVGVLVALPSTISPTFGYLLLGVSIAGGSSAAVSTLLIEKRHINKLRGLEDNDLGQAVPALKLAQAMYAEDITAETIFDKVSQYTPEEFAQFFALFNAQANEHGITTSDDKFIDAFARNADKFTDGQIQNMNQELATRIGSHAELNAARTPFEFGRAAFTTAMYSDETYPAEAVSTIVANCSDEKFAVFNAVLNEEANETVAASIPEKFIVAFAANADKFTDEQLQEMNPELATRIGSHAELNVARTPFEFGRAAFTTAMYSDETYPAEAVSTIVSECSDEKFAAFYAVLSEEFNETGAVPIPEKFIAAFAANGATFTDEQIQEMNPELAQRIHENAVRPAEDGRFGMAKLYFELDRALETPEDIAAAIASSTPVKFAEFVKFLDGGWNLPPQKFIDALALRSEQFPDDLVAQTSEKLCGEIAQHASLPAEQKERFTHWRTLAEMRNKMNQEQILERLQGYSQDEFAAFFAYIDNNMKNVPETLKSALTDSTLLEKIIATLSEVAKPGVVRQLWIKTSGDKLILDLFNKSSCFHRELVMRLYGKLSIEDQALCENPMKSEDREAFALEHYRYLKESVVDGAFDPKVLNTNVVRTLLDAKHIIRASVDNFKILMRGDGKKQPRFSELGPKLVMRILEHAVGVSTKLDHERRAQYPAFDALRESFPEELIKTLSPGQIQDVSKTTDTYVLNAGSTQTKVSAELSILQGLLIKARPRSAGMAKDGEVL